MGGRTRWLTLSSSYLKTSGRGGSDPERARELLLVEIDMDLDVAASDLLPA